MPRVMSLSACVGRLRLCACSVLAMLLVACSTDNDGDGIPVTINLTGTVASPSEIMLDWTEHTGVVSGYDLYRNDAPAYPYHIYGTSYTDRNLNASTQYCYIVYAVTITVGVVGKSNEVCLKTASTAGWNLRAVANGSYPALALDNNNLPHIGFERSDGVAHAIYNGSSWQQALIGTTASSFSGIDLVVDIFNVDQLSYFDYNTNILQHANNATSNWVSSVVDDGGYANSLAVDDMGKAYIAYGIRTTYSSSWLQYASNIMASWQSEFVSGFSNAQIIDTDIVVDAAGGVHIAYAVGGSLCVIRYAYRDPGTGTWDNSTVIDTDARCGASLALDSKGVVHIVYPHQFSLVHTSNGSGSWQEQELDRFSWIGGDRVGLAIDSADVLHIAYQDQNADLKYATNSSGFWQRFYIDSNGDVGDYPSIALASTGKVYIAYVDSSNKRIKLASSP